MPIPCEAAGCFFLTDDDQGPAPLHNLQVNYTVPVRRASGVILDVDATNEQLYDEWTVRARRQDYNSIIDEVIIHGDSAGDGAGKLWQFDLNENIYFITFELRAFSLAWSGRQEPRASRQKILNYDIGGLYKTLVHDRYQIVELITGTNWSRWPGLVNREVCLQGVREVVERYSDIIGSCAGVLNPHYSPLLV